MTREELKKNLEAEIKEADDVATGELSEAAQHMCSHEDTETLEHLGSAAYFCGVRGGLQQALAHVRGDYDGPDTKALEYVEGNVRTALNRHRAALEEHTAKLAGWCASDGSDGEMLAAVMDGITARTRMEAYETVLRWIAQAEGGHFVARDGDE